MGRLGARLKLLRFPLAATTVADVWAGWFGLDPGHGFEPRLIAVHGAALAFYFAGMTLNDAFDAGRDREIHPERPIPSGAISPAAAFAQGFLLLAAGLGLAALAGRALPAALLAGAILAYDGLLKRWALPGALAMGACRYLDVQLGAGFAHGPLFGPALALGIYVAALTAISTLEDSPRLSAAARARVRSLTLKLLLGIFAVDALSLAATGHPLLALATLALALSFPLLAPLARRL